jgi:predicted negative regulator of RcsB-dependent stress response
LTDYLTEQEQVELLKKWIKQYSLFILAGVLIAAIAISGWRYWQQRQNKTYQHASSIFDEMVALRAQQDQDTTSTFQQANKLFSHYSQTAYGEFAALMLARNQVIKKDYPAAEKQLHWVLDHSHISSLKQIARLRLARLLIAEQKPQDALTLLNTTDDKTFNGMIDETKGDAYLSLKNTPMARQWYQQALTDLPNAEVLRPLLQMKYDNLVIYQ